MLTVSANLITEPFDCRAGAMDSGLVRSPLAQAVWVRALTGDFPVLCCVILKLPLSTPLMSYADFTFHFPFLRFALATSLR